MTVIRPRTVISAKDFLKLERWITRASNYIGTARHQVDGTTHFLNIDGEDLAVLWMFDSDDGPGMEYRVDSELYQKFMEISRFEITLS